MTDKYILMAGICFGVLVVFASSWWKLWKLKKQKEVNKK